VADLGCGNGVLGLALAKRNPSTHISFFDESYMAIETAKRNWVSNGLSLDRADFKVSDCLSMYDSDPFDLIVCNPPFHEGRSIAHHVAWRMFSQSKLHLSQEGRFMVVGNRHLDHHLRLARLFGHCHVTGTDGKFVVLTARVLAKKQG
jgi:23S rRNA (guanine1835-N2)-methyltransferase